MNLSLQERLLRGGASVPGRGNGMCEGQEAGGQSIVKELGVAKKKKLFAQSYRISVKIQFPLSLSLYIYIYVLAQEQVSIDNYSSLSIGRYINFICNSQKLETGVPAVVQWVKNLAAAAHASAEARV